MKAGSVRYLVNQGFKGIWRNRMMTFASFCILLVSLLMVGMAVLLEMNISRVISGIEGKSEVMVVIKDGTDDAGIQQLENDLRMAGNVNTVTFYSKEAAWKDMTDGMSDEEKELFDYAEDDNPLPDVFKITVNNIENMSETTAMIETFTSVESTQSPDKFASFLISVRRILTIVGIAVIIALILVSLIIISNTTRASVFSRRKEINIMKYVGATNAFIRIPFFVEGMIVGIFAAIGALFLTKFSYDGIYNVFNSDFSLWQVLGVKNLYAFNDLYLYVALAYIAAGALIGAIGTSISTGKHLRV